MKVPAWVTDGRAVIAVIALAIGVGMGTYLAPFFYHQVLSTDIREFNNSYHFISPLLACSNDADIGDDQARSLQQAIEQNIQNHKDAGDISDISVYYRDLNNGPWVGINFNETFDPGSLLKVPLAMSIYKLSENDPTIFLKKLDYTGNEVDDPQFFKPLPFPTGQHTVGELVTQMLVNSDNNAASLLANEVGTTSFAATYGHLGVKAPPTQGTDYTITAHSFASFFRTLYNATYLDDDGSEALLQLMSKSTFINGIVAGVPQGIVVSHKFGERAFMESNIIELHDCGIVYVPNHPYIICVMTRGTDFPTLAKVIADISKLAYTYTTTAQ